MLDTENILKKLDPSGMMQSINDLPDQVDNCWKQLQSYAVPTHYIKCNKVVILGMGGSAIGGDLTASLALSSSKLPIHIHRDYNLPNFVDHETLVIAVSYSGTTEETLDGFNKAGELGAKLIAISTGGPIESLCRKYRAPIFKIEYGAMPRAALGYLFTSVIGVLNKLGIISLGQQEIPEAVKAMKNLQKKIYFPTPTNQNQAKQLAQKIVNYIPVIMASGTLSQVARRWKNQFNENAKQMSVFESFPELCHNVIVGLDYPKKLNDKIFIISLESEFDHPRNQLRRNIVHQIFRKKGIAHDLIKVNTPQSPLIEMLLMTLLGDYVSYYLSLLNNTDPTPVQAINFLKEKLSEAKDK
ncbi:bifunctional phosphoglucose/phosphomannose isomerase [Candidatus Berkelbacteria bacterium RIFCSPHIGHO2_12_FULL_36_9]|uniref:Bifunctional phosphoglucose/phosphomannose isomerase n=1 Tax=Candidatus Berkelbacteria bacterium RIFCSPHIGHO2_12_FULL_36_9 TaxID=1797469 RepID=A0A1F5EFX2_9BACT|nr:MAG: bifunctional phosphoglucose/phosphomannose isomerase [Candidatus Berkelbacteria bacterium RIFCSPHIGHO2_12_FULL_36_9]